jgi:hypothetical protein
MFEAIGTAATPGLLCQPQVIMKMIMEKRMECRLTGETEAGHRYIIIGVTAAVMWDLWWTKWRWGGGRFSTSTSGSPANFYSTNF